MKKIFLIFIISIIVLVSFIKVFILNQDFDSMDLIYIKDESYLNDFYFDDDYVIFDCNIKIKNTTSQDYYFYMDADVSNDVGLTKEEIAVGYEHNTNERIFFIEGNLEKIFQVKFKSLKGDKVEKTNRLPPESIIIKEED